MPHFDHHIFICENERPAGHPRGCCFEKGSVELRELFKKEVTERGLKSTVRANKSGCLDFCESGPVVVIYPQSVWYSPKNKLDVLEIMDRHIQKGEIVERLLIKDKK